MQSAMQARLLLRCQVSNLAIPQNSKVTSSAGRFREPVQQGRAVIGCVRVEQLTRLIEALGHRAARSSCSLPKCRYKALAVTATGKALSSVPTL